MGDNPANDRLVYHEEDSGYFLSVSEERQPKADPVGQPRTETSEVRYLRADQPDAEPVLVAGRREGHDYDATDQGDRLVIRTNRDGAIDYKLMETPLDAPGEENWTDLVPARDGVLVRGIEVFQDWLVRLETVNALPRIVVTRDKRRRARDCFRRRSLRSRSVEWAGVCLRQSPLRLLITDNARARFRV